MTIRIVSTWLWYINVSYRRTDGQTDRQTTLQYHKHALHYMHHTLKHVIDNLTNYRQNNNIIIPPKILTFAQVGYSRFTVQGRVISSRPSDFSQFIMTRQLPLMLTSHLAMLISSTSCMCTAPKRWLQWRQLRQIQTKTRNHTETGTFRHTCMLMAAFTIYS